MEVAALRRWWPLAAVVGLLVVAALAATRSTPQLDRIPPKAESSPSATPSTSTAPDATATGEPVITPADTGGALPGWFGTAVLVVLGLVALVLLGLVARALLRDRQRRRQRRPRRRPARAAPTAAAQLVAALDAGLQDLSDTDRDPRRAVIACWVRLEEAAAAAGTARHPGDTPGELVHRLLAEQQVDADVLAALAAVYREARYATHTVDERMRASARAALQQLRADLARGARAGGSTPDLEVAR